MENKVSDFRLAESILRMMCKNHGVYFVDIPIGYDENSSCLINIKGSKNVAHSIYKIVTEYISKSSVIVGKELLPSKEQRDNFFLIFSNKLRQFIYNDNRFYTKIEQPHRIHLYQKTLVWILMKDIICPIFDEPLRDVFIVCGESPYLDIARYYKENELPDNKNYEFIFVNNIDNMVVQNALLFLEVLKAYELSPIEVMTQIYKSDIHEKYHGLLEVALNEEAETFEAIIMESLGVNLYDMLPNESAENSDLSVKTAQSVGEGAVSSWWNFGLLEQMLDPNRGSDWSVYNNLQPYVEAFWNNVEKVRQARVKKGHDSGVPFDLLLRIKQRQNVDYKADPHVTLQALLSSDRVW